MDVSLTDEEHEAYGAMIHTMRPYRQMQQPGNIDAHNDLARRARSYQAENAELKSMLCEARKIMRRFDAWNETDNLTARIDAAVGR